MATYPTTSTYRTIFISDLHLGTKEARAEGALEFIAHHHCDYLYLVGDIFDGGALRRSWYWPSSHNAVIHGDEFDGVLRSAKWLSMLGSISYAGLLKLNRLVNHVRGWMGLSYWSFSSFLKYKTKRAVQYVADFEDLVTEKASREEVDGVVCGHIHHPELSRVGDVLYANAGDWVESCTALVEHYDGTLELVRAHRDRHVSASGATHLQGDGARTKPVIKENERI
jgi:UDP-2,3-diacylglucosamine pyrophosphatase LpxH